MNSFLKGRGASENPANRFEKLRFEEAFEEDLPPDEEAESDDPERGPGTVFYRDFSQSVISRNNSPDVGFNLSLNPYRGCEHGCSYCYARPTHEYLGFSSGLEFESKIMVKEDAPDLLRKALSSRHYQPEVLVCSGVTDPYQPVEKRLRITRQCLEVLVEFRHPVAFITKNHLITRDVDLLKQLAEHDAAAAYISITSLDHKLARILEPRASSPQARLKAVRTLSQAGIPVGVMVAPLIPGLNDHEMPAILDAVAEAGASRAGYTTVRLPFAVKEVFAGWLETHMPTKKEMILNRIREIHGGKLASSDFGDRMRGSGPLADQINTLFIAAMRRAGLDKKRPPVSAHAFRRAERDQLELF